MLEFLFLLPSNHGPSLCELCNKITKFPAPLLVSPPVQTLLGVRGPAQRVLMLSTSKWTCLKMCVGSPAASMQPLDKGRAQEDQRTVTKSVHCTRRALSGGGMHYLHKHGLFFYQQAWTSLHLHSEDFINAADDVNAPYDFSDL